MRPLSEQMLHYRSTRGLLAHKPLFNPKTTQTRPAKKGAGQESPPTPPVIWREQNLNMGNGTNQFRYHSGVAREMGV